MPENQRSFRDNFPSLMLEKTRGSYAILDMLNVQNEDSEKIVEALSFLPHILHYFKNKGEDIAFSESLENFVDILTAKDIDVVSKLPDTVQQTMASKPSEIIKFLAGKKDPSNTRIIVSIVKEISTEAGRKFEDHKGLYLLIQRRSVQLFLLAKEDKRFLKRYNPDQKVIPPTDSGEYTLNKKRAIGNKVTVDNPAKVEQTALLGIFIGGIAISMVRDAKNDAELTAAIQAQIEIQKEKEDSKLMIIKRRSLDETLKIISVRGLLPTIKQKQQKKLLQELARDLDITDWLEW